MKRKRPSARPTRLQYILTLIYFIVVLIILALRNTPLNECTPQGLFVVCFGYVDIAYLIVVLPGLIVWTSLYRLTAFLTPSISFDELSSTLGINSFSATFLISWFVTICMVYAVGSILDRHR